MKRDIFACVVLEIYTGLHSVVRYLFLFYLLSYIYFYSSDDIVNFVYYNVYFIILLLSKAGESDIDLNKYKFT